MSATIVGPPAAPPAPQTQRSGPIVSLLLVVVVAAAAMITVKVLIPNDDSSAGYEVPVVVGAVPYWDEEAARTSIDAHAGALTVASPWTYTLTADGSVVLQTGIEVSGEAVQASFLRERGLSVIPTIANTTHGSWDPTTVSSVINDPLLRAAHIASIVDLVTTSGFDGVQIDYEDLSAGDRSAFTGFATDLAGSLHAVGKLLYVTVHPKADDSGYDGRNQAQDYRAIGEAADKVFVMTYDWHWETSNSGPIAPYAWMEQVIRYAVTQIPADKVILGVGLYGYDWPASAAGTPVTWQQVQDLITRYHAVEQWDDASASPHLTYIADDGQQHDVWFENQRSVQLQFDLAREYRLGGIGLWRLGGEDPGIWDPAP